MGNESTRTIAENAWEQILFGLFNLSKLTSAWTSGRCLHHVNELTELVVGVLGRIEDRDTVDLVKCYSDDPILGKSAIAAIKSITEKQCSTRVARRLCFISARISA